MFRNSVENVPSKTSKRLEKKDANVKSFWQSLASSQSDSECEEAEQKSKRPSNSDGAKTEPGEVQQLVDSLLSEQKEQTKAVDSNDVIVSGKPQTKRALFDSSSAFNNTVNSITCLDTSTVIKPLYFPIQNP